MHRAECLKKKGNTLFLEKDFDGAQTAYQEAIIAISEVGLSESLDDVREFLSVVYSNISNVFLATGCYDDSWKAAQESIKWNPTFIKSWFRYVQARRLAGYPFDAFVAMLRYLRPLCREEKSQQWLSGCNITKELEEPLYLALGLSQVSPYIELKDFEGGVGVVACKPMKPNDILFVEKRFEASFAEMELGVRHDLTTSKLVEYFAQKILKDQQEHSERWVRLKKEFKGCWPRTIEDISLEIRHELAAELRPNLPAMSDESFEELLYFAISCRYNCFHSGFFRACALANHSCCANAAIKYNPADATTTLRCVRPIERGEFVHVKYLSDAHFVMGVGKRREHLRSWLFWCACDRCAADGAPSAVQEQRRCPHCGAFTHHPPPGDSGGSGGSFEVDPALPAERPCAHCGRAVVWSGEERHKLAHVMASLGEVTARKTYRELTLWLASKMEEVACFRFHPEHWMYRVLFYFFCVPLTGLISDKFAAFVKWGWRASSAEELLQSTSVRPLYASVVKSAGESRTDVGEEQNTVVSTEDTEGGGDALYCLCVLWRLILPFYPESEGWALHLAICQLVLFEILQVNEDNALSLKHALSLLRRHGKHIGKREAILWVLAYNKYKPDDPRKICLKQKQLKNIFQL